MIKNILIAVLFVALSAFVISATLKSSPEPAKKEKYAKKITVSSFFKDEVEADFLKETGIRFILPDSMLGAGTADYVVSIPEGTIYYLFGRATGANGYYIEFFSRK